MIRKVLLILVLAFAMIIGIASAQDEEPIKIGLMTDFLSKHLHLARLSILLIAGLTLTEMLKLTYIQSQMACTR